MKCRLCKTEMLVDRVVEKEEDGVAEFHYKCPNKQCSNYGYSKITEPQQAEEKPEVEEKTE